MAKALADLFVLFRVEGAQTAEEALDRFHQSADEAGAGAKQMSETVKAGIAAIIEALARIGEAMVRAMGVGRQAAEAFDKSMAKLRQDAGGALEQIGKQAEQGAQKPEGAFGKLQGWLGGVAAAAQRTSQAVQSAFSQMSISVLGFSASIGGLVASGVRFSYIGDQISIYLQRISMAMAGLFRPELERAVNWLRQVTDWLYNLSDAQRESISRWILTGAAMLGAAVIIPRIVAGIQAVTAAVSGLFTAITAGSIASGIGALLPVIGILATGILTMTGGVDGLGRAFAGVWEIVRPLSEGLQAIFRAAASIVEPLLGLMGQLWEMFKPAVEVMMKIGEVILKIIGVGLQMVAGVLKVIGVVLEPVLAMFAKLSEWLGKMATAVLERVLAILERIAATLEWLFGLEPKKLESTGDKSPLPRRVGGPEGIETLFQRTQTDLLNASAGIRNPQEEMLEHSRATAANTGRTAEAVANLRPATV